MIDIDVVDAFQMREHRHPRGFGLDARDQLFPPLGTITSTRRSIAVTAGHRRAGHASAPA